MNDKNAPIELACEPDFRLGEAVISPSLRQFNLNGQSQTIEPRVMKVLVALARRAKEVVSRDELVTRCWDARFIGEDAIQRAAAKVRKLGEDSGTYRVETIPKVGYRLIAPQADTVCDPTQSPARGNLPRRIEGLIGRDEELSQVATILGETELVTITGPGGIGKTRLAYEAGRLAIDEYDDGVWLIELAPLSDPELVPVTIARVLGIQLSDPSDATAELLERLVHWRALLMLDNCEHLLETVATLVDGILRSCPGMKLLVSSQEPLQVEGERVYRLRSLGEADAAQLFITRAKAADAGFTETQSNARAISEICARLDGIPLAIEMAAARAPALGCDALLTLLDDRFRILTGGRRTALPRQRTLRATIEWSYGLLSDAEAVVFRRLGIFVGGFSLDAACHVVSDDGIDRPSVADAMVSLAAKSLVVVDNEQDNARYHLLETTHAYAQEKLAEAGEVNSLQRRHAVYVVASLEGSPRDFMGLTSDEALLAQYRSGIGNVTQALEWAFGPDGDSELIAPLVMNSVTAFAQNSRIQEYLQWAELAERRLDASTPQLLRLSLLSVQAPMHALAYRGSGLDLVERNLRIIGDIDDIALLFPVLLAKAQCQLELGRIEDTERTIDQMSRLVGDAPSRARVVTEYLAALALWAQSGAAQARPHFDAVLANARAIGHGILERIVLIEGSSSVAPQDDAETAIPALRQMLGEIEASDAQGNYLISLCAARLMMLLGLRGGPNDITEAHLIARRVEQTRSRFIDFRYALALACISFGGRHHENAARIAGFADAQRTKLQAYFWFDNIFTDLRTGLLRAMPEKAMTQLWSDGATLTADEALSLAIAE